MEGYERMNKKYKLVSLCHDLLDFDGSRGDMLYFMSRLDAYGIAYEVLMHNTGDAIDINDFDFVFMGVPPQKYEDLLLKQMLQKISGFKEYIESGKVMFAVDQSFLFLGKALVIGDKQKTLCDVFPFYVFQQADYIVGNILLENEKSREMYDNINGFFNSRYAFELPKFAGYEPLGKILLGKDYLWERGHEGLIYKNFIGTQLRGPVLPRNYDLCDDLIRRMTGEKELPTIDSDLEIAAKDQLTKDCQHFIETEEQKKEYVYVS